MLITKEWLDKYKTVAGGYNKKQINELGVDWPPKKDWKANLAGLDIDPESARKFEVASGKWSVHAEEIKDRKFNGKLLIWTDGACIPNPGIGGWGWLDSNGNSGCGGVQETTNNRMELTAIYEAIRGLPNGQFATVYSDSEYCVKGLTIWHRAWKKKDWIKKDAPRINRDLWIQIDAHTSRLNISFVWVRGHSGNAGNERADELAMMGRNKGIIEE